MNPVLVSVAGSVLFCLGVVRCWEMVWSLSR